MSRKTGRSRAFVLGCLVLFMATTGGANVSWGESLSFPEPPRQKDAWKPPASKVPNEFVKAVGLLFEQGLADPRGCEYRSVELTTGGRVHGWVLPAKDGDRPRFAVCWDGLVHPLASVGDKTDLKKDVRAAVNKDKEGLVGPGRDGPPNILSRLDLSTAVLLRLGEGGAASELWVVNNPPRKAGIEPEVLTGLNTYVSLARDWAWTLFACAMDAHARGDDKVALHGFRRLTGFAGAAEGAAKKQGYQPAHERERFFEFLGQMPDLLADQERRSREGERSAVVCVGPGQDSDQQKRIAALVLRLDEVVGDEFLGMPGLEFDPVVRALIREGPPAVEPLLKCLEHDRRLTRCIYSSRWGEISTCQSVHDAAYVALKHILDFTPPRSDTADRKALAARFREHAEKTKGLTAAERRFRVLADDSAEADEWSNAVWKLLSARASWTQRFLRAKGWPAPIEEQPKPLGESLRRKTNPSLTELLLKRIEQLEPWPAAHAALMLAEWEPKAALTPLAEQSKRLLQADRYEVFVEVIEARHKLGDRKALDDYVAFIRSAHPKMLYDRDSKLFRPMADHPDHPGMMKVAEELFADEKSPWLPLIQKRDDDDLGKRSPSYELIPTPLLRVPAFRKTVLKELENKTKLGTAHLRKDGVLRVESGLFSPYFGGRLLPPKEDVKQDVRVCDCYAYLISSIPAAPRCELYWTTAERDKAVATCAAFLRGQQYELSWRSDSLKLDLPATAAQVEKGQAVFSLAGEGEVRVVQGLKLPAEAEWITLKDHPYQDSWKDARTGKAVTGIKYEQHGKVVQAEEVLKDGNWQRYYGFVGANRIARVPAAEVVFPPEARWSEGQEWMPLGSDLHICLSVPPLKIESIDDQPPRLPADAALTFAFLVRNARGVAQPSPDPEKCLRVRLLYSPEIVSRQGALAPKAEREAEWTERTPKPGAKFKTEKGRPLDAAEEMKLATLDLREWFDMSQPGFYRLQLLPASKESGEVGEVRFSLAAPPRKP